MANEVQVVGTDAGGATVIATEGTTINGGTEPFIVASDLQHVHLRLGDGNDSAQITGLLLSNGLTINGEGGDDRVDAQNLNIRFLVVDGGSGNDVLEFHNTFVRRNVNVLGKAGDDTISITAMATDRNFYLDTGDGSDTLSIDNLGVRGRINLNTGSGEDMVVMTGEVYGHKTKIRLGAGNDTLVVTPLTSGSDVSATFQRQLDIKAGSGDDTVFLGAGVDSNKRTKLDGESGNDSLGIQTQSLDRLKVKRFENQTFSNVNQSLDEFYTRLTDAGVDTTPFGRVTEVQTPPVLSVSNTALDIAQDAGPIAIDSELSLTGSDSTRITGATINVVDPDSSRDVLAFTNTTAISGSFNPANGTLALSGNASIAEYQAALRTVTYDDLNNPSIAANRQVNISVSSNAGTATASRTLNIAGLAAPVFRVADSPLQLDRSASATPVDDQIVLTGNGFNATGATIQVENNIFSEDRLAFSNTDKISGSFDTTAGTLTLTGTATLAEYQSALRTVTFDNTSSTFTGIKPVLFTVTTERGTLRDSRQVQILSDAQAIQNFAAANSLQLQETDSGLQYIIETPGNNIRPTAEGSVRLMYRGTLLDGTQFDFNDNATFPLDGVIPGFREGLLLFSEGSTGQLFIPSSLAYGETGSTNIPPNAVLRFEIEILEVIAPT